MVRCALIGHWGLMILIMIKDEQIDKYQIPLRDGKMIGAIAMTEPGGGSDLQGIRTNAVRNHFYIFQNLKCSMVVTSIGLIYKKCNKEMVMIGF